MDQRSADQLRDALNRHLRAGADIDRFTFADPFGLSREDVGPHHVAHPGEVARLLAVAVNRHRLAARPLVHEDADDQAVRAFGDLPRAVHVEVP